MIAMEKLPDKFFYKKFMEKITKRPKNKKEEQSQINAILFYLRTQNKNRGLKKNYNLKIKK